jgi:hypothetical protein
MVARLGSATTVRRVAEWEDNENVE